MVRTRTWAPRGAPQSGRKWENKPTSAVIKVQVRATAPTVPFPNRTMKVVRFATNLEEVIPDVVRREVPLVVEPAGIAVSPLPRRRTLRPVYPACVALGQGGASEPLFLHPVQHLASCKKLGWSEGLQAIVPRGKSRWLTPSKAKCPGNLTKRQAQFWDAEEVLRAAPLVGGRTAKRFESRMRLLEFIRATFDAACMGFQSARKAGWRPCAASRRWLRRFKARLVNRPAQAAKDLKSLAGEMRAWRYGAKIPARARDWSFTTHHALLFSFVARALPPPPRDGSLLDLLKERLRSDPMVENLEWKPYVQSYVRHYAPKEDPPGWTAPSGHSALGYPRSKGGHATAITDLVKLGYALFALDHTREGVDGKPCGMPLFLQNGPGHLEPMSGEDIPMNDACQAYWESLESTDTPPDVLLQTEILKDLCEYERPDALVSRVARDSAFSQAALRLACKWVLDNLEVVPVLPLYAEEHGLKVRYPTCTLTAVNLVQQQLRRAVDHVMLRDPRCRNALGSEKQSPLHGLPGPWYSQDATAATDYHPEWLTRTVYEVVIDNYPILEPYRRYLGLLFGRRRILPGSSSDYADIDLSPMERTPIKRGPALWIVSEFRGWLKRLALASDDFSKVGQMMGDPTSFPPMMILSSFAAHKAIREFPLTRKETRQASRIRWTRHLMPGDAPGRFCGDDGLLPFMTNERRLAYDRHCISCGMRLSEPKCFWHPTRGLFCEVPFTDGVPKPKGSLALWNAPPGGSKGQTSWYTQPSVWESYRSDHDLPQDANMFSYSPFHGWWDYAYAMGLPLGAPIGYGGLNHPRYPCLVRQGISEQDQFRWYSLLAGLGVTDLYLGTGLSLLPAGSRATSDVVERTWLEVTRAGMTEWSDQPVLPGQNGIPLEDAIVRVAGVVRPWEAYVRAPPKENSTPSVVATSSKFLRRIRSRPPISGRLASIRKDHERKLGRVLIGPATFLPEVQSRFGLTSSKSGPLREKWFTPDRGKALFVRG